MNEIYLRKISGGGWHISIGLYSVTSPPIDSAHPQKVGGMHRIRWTACSGFTGRHRPDYVAAFISSVNVPLAYNIAMCKQYCGN